jgi:hypothetical protein
MPIEFWWGKLLENGHMEDREGGKIALKWIVEKYVKF